MAQVPCAPVPDTGRQGTIEVLKYVILLPWHAKPRNPTEVVHVWTTIPSLDHNPSPSVVAFPPIRPSVPAWRIKRLARSPAGMYGRAAVTQGPSGTPPRQSVNIKPPHSSTTPPLPSPPPAHRYPAPPPSWQHCPRVPESLRRTFVDFPCWTLDLALRFPLSSSSPVRNEINY